MNLRDAVDADHRLIGTGRAIPTESYADQPYVVQTDDEAWLCTVTTGRGFQILGLGGPSLEFRQ